jgi:CheY-like chemotaxis protein
MVDCEGPQKKVLLVEDDQDTRDVVRLMLEHAGYPVVTASNGEEALTYLKNNEHPCLILLDMVMPLMNGRQLLAALRRSDTLAPLPVVVVSATPEDMLENGVRASQGFVRKPIDFDVLLKFVSKYC